MGIVIAAVVTCIGSGPLFVAVGLLKAAMAGRIAHTDYCQMHSCLYDMLSFSCSLTVWRVGLMWRLSVDALDPLEVTESCMHSQSGGRVIRRSV